MSDTIDDFKFVIGTTSGRWPLLSSRQPAEGFKDRGRYKQDGKTVLHGQSGANGANHMHSIEMFKHGRPEKVVPYSGASAAGCIAWR